jgi:hypothetical protein
LYTARLAPLPCSKHNVLFKKDHRNIINRWVKLAGGIWYSRPGIYRGPDSGNDILLPVGICRFSLKIDASCLRPFQQLKANPLKSRAAVR